MGCAIWERPIRFDFATRREEACNVTNYIRFTVQ